MNIELERSQIIEALNHVNDEWLIKAIKRLLGIDFNNEAPDNHKKYWKAGFWSIVLHIQFIFKKEFAKQLIIIFGVLHLKQRKSNLEKRF